MKGGIDLGGTKILAVVVDESHAVVGEARRPTPATAGPKVVAEHMAEALSEAAAEAGAEPAALAGIGIGAPGAVDAEAGTVASSGNISGWQAPFPLASAISDALGPPVFLGNDVGVAVLGEARLGSCRPYHSFLGVWWGTGVGGGVVLDGKRWVGRGKAGEFGHMVIRKNGAVCPCGRRGCVEAYAGRRAMELRARKRAAKGEKTELFKIMEKRGVERLASGVWARALKKGDRMAVSLVDRGVEAIACGAASVVNLLDLEAVVIGGGLGTRLGQPFADRISEAMLPHLFVRERPPAVHTAALGDYAGAVGATLLVPKETRAKRAVAAVS